MNAGVDQNVTVNIFLRAISISSIHLKVLKRFNPSNARSFFNSNH